MISRRVSVSEHALTFVDTHLEAGTLLDELIATSAAILIPMSKPARLSLSARTG